MNSDLLLIGFFAVVMLVLVLVFYVGVWFAWRWWNKKTPLPGVLGAIENGIEKVGVHPSLRWMFESNNTFSLSSFFVVVLFLGFFLFLFFCIHFNIFPELWSWAG
jgi:K+-transporting ATPase A subunit